MLSAAILAFALPVANAAAATNYTVSTTSDTSASGGACGNTAIKTAPSPLSLREATCLANNVGGEVNITVPAGEYKLSNGELIPAIAVGQTVNYIGAGAASTIVNAQGLSRVFNFDSKVVGSINAKVSGLEITGGADNTFGGAGIIAGSANLNNADELTLESVLVKGNVANASAPTITNRPGGGVQMASGKLTVINSTFTENKSYGSKGSALAVISNENVGGPQGVKIVGSTFSLNESGNGFTASNPHPGGGALYLDGGSGTNEITETKFIGNEVNSPTVGGAEGAAIFQDKTAPTTITRSIFSENKVSSPSGGPVQNSAIASENSGNNFTLHFNRFHANNTSTAIGGTGTWNATDNWWGCNTGANTAGCDGAAAGITTTPYLKLNASASPTTLAGPNATSTLQGDFLHDSANNAISEANLTAFAGEPLTWSDPKPAGATINGHAAPETTTTNIASGKATATYNSQSTTGAGHAVVAFDNASVTIPLTVDQVPQVTQNPSDQHVTPGATATFTAAASGTPTPSVQWQRDTGSGFTNIGGATSTTYSFTTASGETGYKFRAVFTNTIEGTPYTATTTAATLFVGKATTSLSTSATSGTIGGSIKDTATLSGGFSPTGTITFEAYGPSDATCSGTVAYTKSQTVTANGDYESEEFTPTAAGAYRWVVEYSGDGNNEVATSGCNAANETSTVAKATPTLSTKAHDGTAGIQAIEDISDLENGHGPTGTITFKAYGPDDATCSEAPAYTHIATAAGNGHNTSDQFLTNLAGEYRWTAEYSGDVNNEAVAEGCNANEETSIVEKASPQIETVAEDGDAGAPIHDTASIFLGAGETGTITFEAFGPDDATCSGPPAFTDSEPVDGNGNVESAPFTPLEAGAYRWTAEYSGDTNNEPTAEGCNEPEETSTVGKAKPKLATQATDAAFGGAIHDTATLSGGAGPTGTITFKAYGPDDTSCAGVPAFSATVKAEGEGFYGSGDFTPTQSGTYRWVASYSGDANNRAGGGVCGNAGETSTVAAAPVPPSPPAISPCPATSPSVAPFEPPKKTVNGPVPGVRARIAVARPSQLEVTATLKYHRGGKAHSVGLGTAALLNEGTANLKLALPAKLAKALPIGTKVHLTLSIAAYPAGTEACSAQPEISTQHLRTKVVRVLVG